jgi:hypothetical protein
MFLHPKQKGHWRQTKLYRSADAGVEALLESRVRPEQVWRLVSVGGAEEAIDNLVFGPEAQGRDQP